MKDIMVHSISGVAERYKRLNLSGSKGQRTKEGLLSRNLVQENSVSHGKGSIKMLRITESGKEALVSSGIDASTLKFSQRLGGPEHRYWKEKMANELEEKGFQVEKEHQTPNGKFVDIVAKKGDKRAAVEIETGKSNALDNIRKDIQSEFDSVIVVTTSEKERKRLLDELNKRT
jgi:predicted AAA+ superfamily ATPase